MQLPFLPSLISSQHSPLPGTVYLLIYLCVGCLSISHRRMREGFALFTAVAQRRSSSTRLERARSFSLVMAQEAVGLELGGGP